MIWIIIITVVISLLFIKLITHLHDVVLRRDESGNPIETKLHQISRDLHSVIKSYVHNTIESMVRSAQDKCPNVLSEEKVVDDIRSGCLSKSQVSSQLVNEAIVEQAGSVILNKVNEVNLGIASIVSDRVIDEVVDSLSKACKVLQTGEGPRKRAMTGTELTSRERGSSESSTRSERSTDAVSQGDDTSQKSDPSPLKLEYLNLATPQLASKRKSLHGRKLRPQSVVAESLDSVSELPSNSGQLQHLGKARPRRVKTRAPTRPMGRADVLEEDHDISQGVDTFFRPGSATPTTPLVSPDSENSPRLCKFGSTSSMDSFPHTTGARTASERGSIESLTRSESDTARDSPRSRNKSEEEYEEEEEKSDENTEEKRSVSSLIGKLGGECVLKLSPDLSARRLTSLGTEEKSKDEDDNAKRGVPKYGARGAIGGNLLAEMKARQEKRSSFISKDEDKKEGSSPGLLGGVKLRSTGRADNLKSPTNGFSRSKSPTNRDSNTSQDASGDTSPLISHPKPQIMAVKSKPPPPLAPKPRPKSSFMPDIRTASESEGGEGDDVSIASHRSVKELAASLANKATPTHNNVSTEEAGKKKSSSLPRNSVPVVAGASTAGIQSSPCITPTSANSQGHHKELGSPATEGETETSTLSRQTSHKHVLTSSEMTIEDIVDV